VHTYTMYNLAHSWRCCCSCCWAAFFTVDTSKSLLHICRFLEMSTSIS